MDLVELGLIVLVGVAAGTVNTLAGGGSLITLPALIVLGLPAGVANGTNRVGVFFQSLVATWRFHRAGQLDLGRALPLLVPTCLASTAGALASVQIDDERFENVIGVAMVLMAGVVLARPRRWLEDEPARGSLVARVLAFLAIGLYGGFLQAGVGIFLLAGLVLLSGHDLVRANAAKSLLVAGFTVPPLVVFALEGLIDPWPAVALTVGSSLGAALGTRLAIAKGAPLLRWVLVVVVLASAAKLLWPDPAPTSTTEPADHGLQLLHRGNEDGPVLIAVHGRGDAPERFAPLYEALYDRVHVVLPQAPTSFSRGYSWFPTRAREDGSDALATGVMAAAWKVGLLAESLVDGGRRPVLTGFSQGGMISFTVAARQPWAIEAAVPVGGLLPEGLPFDPDPAGELPPVRAFHGVDDTLVPEASARRSVDLLARGGWDATLRSYEGIGHRIPSPLRDDYLATLESLLE